jgi:hypothetical protein
VLAPHREVGETTVRREDTRDMPGTFGDPTRFAETLPGVVPTVSALQAFFVRECVTPNVNGRAYGLEVLLRRSFAERLTAWISYTLSRSTRQARGPGDDEPTMTILSEYDRTHVVSAVASYDFGGGWRAGGRVSAYTGRPYSATSEGIPVVPYNTERLPGYYRIDARIEKSWMLGERDRISVVLEGLNVTLNKEPVSVLCVAGPGGSGAGSAPSGRSLDTCTAQTVGPLTIPSIGVEGTFR